MIDEYNISERLEALEDWRLNEFFKNKVPLNGSTMSFPKFTLEERIEFLEKENEIIITIVKNMLDEDNKTKLEKILKFKKKMMEKEE